MLFRLHPLRGLILALAILLSLPLEAALKTDVEYYIWLNIYEKLMGSSEDGSAPALSAYTVNGIPATGVFSHGIRVVKAEDGKGIKVMGQ